MFLSMLFQVIILVLLSAARVRSSKYFLTKDRFTWKEALEVSTGLVSSISDIQAALVICQLFICKFANTETQNF